MTVRRFSASLLLLAFATGLAAAAPPDPYAVYTARWAPRLLPLLSAAVAFETVAGNAPAFAAQAQWLQRTAESLGLVYRDQGAVAEIELPGPAGAPVLGLAVHGDVVPVSAAEWSTPPFVAVLKDGVIQARGVADDKGPLVQALLAMKALQESGRPRTRTIRLLVGSDEETTVKDMPSYLATHAAPDLTLVLDAYFPVVVGEMSNNSLLVEAAPATRGDHGVRLLQLQAGLVRNIIPGAAVATLEVAPAALPALRQRIAARPLPPGTRLEFQASDGALIVSAFGRAAHAGMNPQGGRNALVALATAIAPELPPGSDRDVLTLVQQAGVDVNGTGLGLTEAHPVFGRAVAAPTLLTRQADGSLQLWFTIRSHPSLSGDVLTQRVQERIARFNAEQGAQLRSPSRFTSEPLVHDPQSPTVQRLLAAYARGTGTAAPPAISAGGTYAKRMPNAYAFGMWMPGKPYTGHDVDERVPVADLHLGVKVLLEALQDFTGEPAR
ncbi:MAG: Sapep family Mn(2+)-dependent dipeptidase [Roseateles sp.]|jgi:predicted dipeptidase